MERLKTLTRQIKVTVFVRHGKTCEKASNSSYRECDCPKFLQYSYGGKQHRPTANTRIWSVAEARAKELAKELEARLSAEGIKPRGFRLPEPVLSTPSPVHRVKTYLIESPQMEAVKIGISSDVVARLKACQTGNPDKLRLVGTMEGNHEPTLHKRFEDACLGGEWFKASPVLTWWESLQQAS